MSPTRFGPQPFRPHEGGDARGPGIAALMSLNVERLAAAATALLVRVAEHEPRLQLLLDVVHFGADDEHNGLRVDQDVTPLSSTISSYLPLSSAYSSV